MPCSGQPVAVSHSRGPTGKGPPDRLRHLHTPPAPRQDGPRGLNLLKEPQMGNAFPRSKGDLQNFFPGKIKVEPKDSGFKLQQKSKRIHKAEVLQWRTLGFKFRLCLFLAFAMGESQFPHL